jgi:hypothetical protein
LGDRLFRGAAKQSICRDSSMRFAEFRERGGRWHVRFFTEFKKQQRLIYYIQSY